MKYHMIHFTVPMVQAILDERKFVTRRLGTSVTAARMEAGDRLWVREHYRVEDRFAHLKPGEAADMNAKVRYGTEFVGQSDVKGFGKLRTPRTMPRQFSRLNLIITDIHVEPLHAITEADAILEGVQELAAGKYRNYHDAAAPLATARGSYATLWDEINTGFGERWSENPDVYRIKFYVEGAQL